MKIAKYNILKGVSTALTIGTPIVTLISCGQLFVHRSDTAISAAGIFALLISLLLFKDKIVENWKMPSAFLLSVCCLVLVILIENILLPIKYVCIASVVATGVDEVSFKRLYKSIEANFTSELLKYKHFGFICTSSANYEKLMSNQKEKINE